MSVRMRRKGLIPLELTDPSLLVEAPMFAAPFGLQPQKNQVIFSDLLSDKGV